MVENLESKFRNLFDTWAIRHPVAVSGLVFLALEYFRQKHPGLIPYQDPQAPQADLLASYGVYTGLGLIKEYVVEGRNLKAKSFYEWILNNPKILAATGAVIGSTITYNAESQMSDVSPGGALRLAVAHGVQAGILTEAVIRSLKNLKRIKKGIRKIKTRFSERAYNFILEHPLALSAAAFFYYFNQNYLSRSHKLQQEGTNLLTGSPLEDLVNNPGTMISVASRSGLETAVTLGGLLVAGSTLHSFSLREAGLRAAKLYYNTTGEREKAASYQSRIASLPNSLERVIEDVVELGNLYYEQGKKDEAYKNYRRALRLFAKKSDHISYADFFRRTFKLDKIRRPLKRKKYSKKLQNEREAINLLFIDLLNKDRRALDNLKELAEKAPDNFRLSYLYGRALEVAGFLDEGREQKQRVVRQIIDSGVEIKTRAGSKNLVIEIDDDIIRETIIAKRGKTEKLRLEERTTLEAREFLRDFDDYDVPVPIGVMDIKGSAYYVMEYASGELLADRIRASADNQEKREELKRKVNDVAYFMGLLHAKLKPGGERRDSLDAIEERLAANRVPEEVKRMICINLYPAVNAVYSVLDVQNKAAHPSNWILDDFGVVAIDLEADRVVPITFDTVNLIEQHGRFTDEEKDEVFTTHIESFKKFSGVFEGVDLDKYRLAYLNSVILRNLEVYSMLRRTDRELMLNSLENAQHAVVRIRRDYPDYYKHNATAYRMIDNGLERLKTI